MTISKYQYFIYLLLGLTPFYIQGQEQYIACQMDSSPESITFLDDTFISEGCGDDTFFQLDAFSANQDGHIEFHFGNFNSTDEVHVRLEQKDNPNTYYQFRFAVGNVYIEDHEGTNISLPNSVQQTQNIFRLERCNGQITWYERGNKVLFTIGSVNNALVAKVESINTNEVLLYFHFRPDNTLCDKCSIAGGTTLYPGDLMFSAYDNTLNDVFISGLTLTEQDVIQVRTQVDLLPGTHFTITEGAYESNTEYWYAGNGRADETIASQQITYTGTMPIDANSTICFNLAHGETGSSLLAKNFFIDGNNRDADFCVKNVGNTANPEINLTINQVAAIFLMQGDWKYANDHGIFCGRVLSGLQYGAAWIENNANLPTNSRRSQIPPDINCIYIENTGTPSDRYAEYAENHSNNDYSTIVESIANFVTNWTVNNEEEDLLCGNPTRWTMVNFPSLKVYPNPYCSAFFAEFELNNAERVSLEIWDVNGRLLRQVFSNRLFEKGKHQIEIKNNFANRGQYLQLLRLISPQGTSVEKILNNCSEGEENVPILQGQQGANND